MMEEIKIKVTAITIIALAATLFGGLRPYLFLEGGIEVGFWSFYGYLLAAVLFYMVAWAIKILCGGDPDIAPFFRRPH